MKELYQIRKGKFRMNLECVFITTGDENEKMG